MRRSLPVVLALAAAAAVVASAEALPSPDDQVGVSHKNSTPTRLAWLSSAAQRDYRAWLALGPGGLPSDVGGWMIATLLRPLARETRSVQMYAGDPQPEDPLILPRRLGDRPVIAPWVIPHRQSSQLPSASMRAQAAALVGEIAGEGGAQLRVSTSKFERHGPAIFVASRARAPWLRDSRSEAGHVHPSDGSLHLVLRPADAKAVIEAGWGERHPLDGVPLLGLPTNYLMIYAPRETQELEVVRTLLRRATGG